MKSSIIMRENFGTKEFAEKLKVVIIVKIDVAKQKLGQGFAFCLAAI